MVVHYTYQDPEFRDQIRKLKELGTLLEDRITFIASASGETANWAESASRIISDLVKLKAKIRYQRTQLLQKFGELYEVDMESSEVMFTLSPHIMRQESPPT